MFLKLNLSRLKCLTGLTCSLSFVLSINPSYANETSQTIQTISLSQAIQKTLAHYPSLEVFQYKQQGLNAERAQAKLSPQSSLSVEAENLLGSGNRQAVRSAEFTISLSSVLELGGKLEKRVELVNQKIKLTDHDKQLESLNLIARVSRQFIEALAAQAQVTIAQQNVNLAQSFIDKINKKRSIGAAGLLAEITLAQAELASAKMKFKTAQQNFETQKMLLSLFWQNSPTQTPYSQYDKLTGNLFEFGQSKTFNQLFSQLNKNPQVALLSAKQSMTDAKINLSQAANQTDINWTLGVRYSREIGDAGFVAGIGIPLSQSERNQSQVQAAFAEKNELLAEQQTLLKQLQADLYQIFNLREQHLTAYLAIENEILPLLNQALEQSNQAYQLGRYSYTEWLNVKQALVEAQQNKITHAKQILILTTEIEALTGQSLFASPVTPPMNVDTKG